MALKDLSAYLTPELELPYRDTVYVVPPPSKDVGLKLAAINAVGVASYAQLLEACPTCGRTGSPEVPAKTLALVESIGNMDVALLSLGQDVYDRMVADGVPGPHIDQLGLYALYYWTLGEQVADQIMAAQHGGGGAPGEAVTSSTSTRGRRTGSASKTRSRASSPRTGGSRRR